MANITPEMMMLEMLGQMQSVQPVDPATVARELWNPAFVESISKKLAEGKSDETVLVSALASCPSRRPAKNSRSFCTKGGTTDRKIRQGGDRQDSAAEPTVRRRQPLGAAAVAARTMKGVRRGR